MDQTTAPNSNPAATYIERLTSSVAEQVFGLDRVIRLLAMTRIAGGHALLQGPPGIGKTLLAKSFAQAIGGEFRRVQGTPDLMPGDVTGISVFNSDTNTFEFKQGPLFSDVVLVDEINRAGPKTQSALLEAMEERRVTIDGNTHNLPANFLVIATQNPVDFEGTYPLPESQVDRFLIRLDMAHTDRESEAKVLSVYGRVAGSHQQTLQEMENETNLLEAARASVDSMVVEPALVDYVLDICEATRRSEELTLGLSTRAARALLLMARVEACAQNYTYVRPDDLQAIAHAVANHRLTLTPEVSFSGRTSTDVMADILARVPVPRVEAKEERNDGVEG